MEPAAERLHDNPPHPSDGGDTEMSALYGHAEAP